MTGLTLQSRCWARLEYKGPAALKQSGEVVRFRRLPRWFGLALLVACPWLQSTRALAFTDPTYFYRPAAEGGSEGRWFTGAPADGYGCGVCHSGKPSEALSVEGLPAQGYVPGESYAIRISWRQVADRTRLLYDTQPAERIPRASLVAELMSETGEDNGSIVPSSLSGATAGELCHSARKRLGAALYRQTPRLETEAVGACDGRNFTRCLVAVRGCGSEEVRFTWTAPAQFQGTVWFSAGFVATDRISGSPLEDAVTEVTIPIAAAGMGGYRSELKQTCGVGAAAGGSPRGAAAGLMGFWVSAIFTLVWRAVRRRGARR